MQDRHHISGIREPLPRGEIPLWEGQPETSALARYVLHVRLLAAYFVVLLAFSVYSAGPAGGDLLARVTWIVGLGAVVLGMAWGYAAWIRRTTRYSITNRRVIIQKGAVLPSVANIPFRRIQNITFAQRAGGGGEIALELVPGARLGYTFLWPHARPWKLSRPQPMLRCLADVDEAADVLREAYAAFLEAEGPAAQTGRTEYRLLDDDDTTVLTNAPRKTAQAAGATGDRG